MRQYYDPKLWQPPETEDAQASDTERVHGVTEEEYRRGYAHVPNHYYFYCVDEDFGPLFLKLCSYFPYGRTST